MRSIAVLSLILLVGCGEKTSEPPECRAVAATDFDVDSGWGAGDYCAAPTDLGCYPWHESSADTCGPFISMRTTATAAASADACRTLLSSLNCNEYASADGDRLGFYIEDPDRFTMRAVGTYLGAEVDTTFYFNPCHQNCQAAVTLQTLDPNQQKVCDIPIQGKPVCMFPETAHSITFVRADGGSVVLRTSGQETAMERVQDGT